MSEYKVKVHKPTDEDKKKRRIRVDFVVMPKPIEITITFKSAKE